MRTILNTLRILLSIENTININAIINGIRHLPIIGKQIPETIYDIPAIKVLATIMSVIKEIMWAFFGRFCLFVFLFFVGAILSSLNDFSQNCAFLYGFLAYSILEMLIYNIFRIWPETEYSVFFLGMDAKRYISAKFFYTNAIVIISYTLFGVPLALLSRVPFFLAILIPVAGVGFRALTLGIQMSLYAFKQSRHSDIHKKKPSSIEGNQVIKVFLIFVEVFFGFAGLFAVFYYNLFLPLAIVLILAAIAIFPGLLLIKKFPYGLYRTALFAQRKRDTEIRSRQEKRAHGNTEVKINEEKEIKKAESKESGFKFLNELFFKRHSGIFIKRLIITTIVTIIGIGFASLFLHFELGQMEEWEYKSESVLRFLILKRPAMFTFLVYTLNSGSYMAHAMYANCDSSLLMFSFYKKPKALWKMYLLRLKAVCLYNLLPVVLMAVFSIVVIALTGGADNIFQYPLTIAVMILTLIYTSMRHLTIYYVLQPYAKDIMIKSKLYSFIQFVVGFALFILMVTPIPVTWLVLLGIIIIAFDMLFSYILIKHISPKTFKIK